MIWIKSGVESVIIHWSYVGFLVFIFKLYLESPLDCKEIQRVHSKGDQPWDFFGGNDAEAETSVLWPPHAKSWLIGKNWCWEGLGAGGEGDDRGWNGWMASVTWWTWVWMNSGSWWWTGRPGVLWFMGSQRVGHDWATELNWADAMVMKDIYLNGNWVSILRELAALSLQLFVALLFQHKE